MSILHELVRAICETEPGLLRELPCERVDREVDQAFRTSDIYFVEQVDKVMHVGSRFDPRDVERRMYEALADCRVDDFCYLLDLLGERAVVDPERIAACYEALACTGNVAGLEAVIKKTGVAARLDARTAERAYEVLLAMGRLGAVDYVRQLSGVPVSFTERAVQTGYRVLFLAGRYEAALEMRRLTGVAPAMSAEEVDGIFDRAVRDLRFSGVKILGELLGRRALPKDAIAGHLDRLVARGRFAEIPHLFELCEAPPIELLPREVLANLLERGAPEAIRFVYAHDALLDLQIEHREVAYQQAVARVDRRLVRTICERTGLPLRPGDVLPLVEDALDEVDPEWLQFALAPSGGAPAVDPALVQVFLYELQQRSDPRLEPMSRLLGVQLDEARARTLHAVKRGDFGGGGASLREVVVGVTRALAGSSADLHGTSRPRRK